MKSRKKIARWSGFLYLIHFLAFFMADNGIHSTAVGSLDAVATAKQIILSEGLFRFGFVSFLCTAIFFFLAAWALYVLLRSVNQDIAMLFLLLNLGGVAVWCSAQVSELGVLLLLGQASATAAFSADQLQALATLLLSLFQNGYMIAQILLNLWLFPLGYLVFKSGFLPKIFGIGLLVDGLAMLIWFLQFFFLPDLGMIGSLGLAVAFIAEASFCLWLLIKGVRNQPPAPDVPGDVYPADAAQVQNN